MVALLRRFSGWVSGIGREGGAPASPLRRLLAALMVLLGSAMTAHAQQPTSSGVPAAVSHGWWDQTAHFLVQPWATIALLVAGCLLIYWDLLTPKTWDLSGTSGVILVGMVFASQITVGDTGWVGILLLLAGLAAVLLEIHVFPGYGSAIAGFVLMFAGMFLSLGGTQKAAFALSVTAVLTVVTGIAFLAYLPKSPAWKRLSQQMHQQQNGVDPNSATFSTASTGGALVGQTGKVLTDLRPAGFAEVNGVRLQVVTEGDFLSPGVQVVVTEVEGDRVVVNPVNAPQATVTATA